VVLHSPTEEHEPTEITPRLTVERLEGRTRRIDPGVESLLGVILIEACAGTVVAH
jgi:hypothetical protein